MLTCRSDVEGDPTSWLRMLSGLRTIRSTSTHKNVQLLVVVVQDGPLTELPQDRLTGLCSNLNIEQRYTDLESPPTQLNTLLTACSCISHRGHYMAGRA